MSDLIYKNITPQDIVELEEIVEKEPEFTDDVLFDINHEILFHGKLYEITKNKTLKNFQNMLLPVFNYTYDSGLINLPISKKRYVSHNGLIEVLKNGNPKKFREAMRKHLDNHFNRLFE
jgi:DNA-binding FadR family transcriptional regulator